MTQIATTIGADRLKATLTQLGEQRRLILWLTRLVRAAWLWCAALGAVLMLDAAAPTSGYVRVVFGVLLLAAVPVGLWATRTRQPDARRGALRDARHLERHHALPHNPLVNGLLLSPLVRGGDVLAATLAGRTHDRAQRVIERIDRQVVVDRAALRRELGYASVVAIAWLTTLIVSPGVIGVGLSRLVMPFEDTPPFALTRIALAAEPAEPFVGDDVVLTATASGAPVERMELAELDEDLNVLRRWPMRAQAAAAFVRTLRALDRPILVQAEANGSRSKRLLIEPKPRPVEDSPAEAGSDAPRRAERPQPRMMQPQDPNETFDLAGQFPQIHEKLLALQEQARRIGQMIEQLNALDPESPEFAGQLDALEAELAKFREDAGELSAMCRAAKDGATPTQRQLLEQLAEALESLSLCKLGNCPVGIGFGTGPGLGGGQGAALHNWLAGARLAQMGDMKFLMQIMRDLGMTSPFGDAGPRLTHATALPGPPDPEVGGEYAEAYDVSEASGPVPPAVMGRVPPAYRRLVQRYYERLAEDERARP